MADGVRSAGYVTDLPTPDLAGQAPGAWAPRLELLDPAIDVIGQGTIGVLFQITARLEDFPDTTVRWHAESGIALPSARPRQRLEIPGTFPPFIEFPIGFDVLRIDGITGAKLLIATHPDTGAPIPGISIDSNVPAVLLPDAQRLIDRWRDITAIVERGGVIRARGGRTPKKKSNITPPQEAEVKAVMYAMHIEGRSNPEIAAALNKTHPPERYGRDSPWNREIVRRWVREEIEERHRNSTEIGKSAEDR